MNKKRRAAIDSETESLRLIHGELTMLMEEEQDSFDNLPESLQDCEKGQAMTESVDNLQEAKGES